MDEHAAALQNLGLSGVPFCGVDVGGFFGDCDGELLARWTEFGIFQPFCRNHSCKGTVPQEPWAFGEPYETVCRDMLTLRMRLLPYLYSAFADAAQTGAPILRPLLFDFPEDPVTYRADDQFLFGDALLVAPITGRASSTATSTSRRARGCSGGRARGQPARRTSSPTRRSAGRRSTRRPTR